MVVVHSFLYNQDKQLWFMTEYRKYQVCGPQEVVLNTDKLILS